MGRMLSAWIACGLLVLGCQNRVSGPPSAKQCFTDSDCGLGSSCNPFTRECQTVELPDAAALEDAVDAPPEPPPEPEADVCAAGVACDDLDPCTAQDVCGEDGACAGTPFSCDDGIECTIDTCDSIGGCDYAIRAGFCLINAVCIEAGALATGDACSECLPSISTDQWSYDDTNTCDDGDACTTDTHCSGGACVGGSAVECNDDEVACTTESCDPDEGCSSTPDDAACDDDDACTDDLCDPEQGCVSTAIPDCT